jgi:hypothetical protein
MVFYPIAQIICFIPATINRLYNIITKEELFSLMVIQAILDYSLGFIITMIFLSSPSIKYTLLAFIKRLCNKNKKTMETTMLSEDIQGRSHFINHSF